MSGAPRFRVGPCGDGQGDDYCQAFTQRHTPPDAWLFYSRFGGEPPSTSVRVRNSNRTLHTVGIDLTSDMQLAIDQIKRLESLLSSERGLPTDAAGRLVS